MSVLDVQEKACLRNFRHVQRYAYAIACLICWNLNYLCSLFGSPSIFVFTLIFLFFLLEICWRFSKLDNSIAVKWYQSLDDESRCSVYSLRIKFKVDLSFNESRRLYSIKFEKAYPHRRVGKMKCWKEFMKETLKTPGTFNLDSVI